MNENYIPPSTFQAMTAFIAEVNRLLDEEDNQSATAKVALCQIAAFFEQHGMYFDMGNAWNQAQALGWARERQKANERRQEQ